MQAVYDIVIPCGSVQREHLIYFQVLPKQSNKRRISEWQEQWEEAETKHSGR